MLVFFFKAIPFKATLVKWGASLPLVLRSKLGTRIFGKIARLWTERDASARVTTTLGISNAFKVSMPVNSQATYLFGLPQHYNGERGVLFLAKYLAKHCGAIADIGANWGFHTLYFAHHFKRPIYFFEPNTPLFENTQQALLSNGLTHVKGFNAAIGGHTGTVEFYLNRSDDLSSSLVDIFERQGHTVEKVVKPIFSFDDFSDQNSHKKWFLKVDIESAEDQFAEGARRSLEDGRIAFLVIELLESARSSGFVNKLIDMKLHAYYVNDFRLEHATQEDGRYQAPEYNWLFCHHAPEQLRLLLQGTEFTVQ